MTYLWADRGQLELVVVSSRLLSLHKGVVPSSSANHCWLMALYLKMAPETKSPIKYNQIINPENTLPIINKSFIYQGPSS